MHLPGTPGSKAHTSRPIVTTFDTLVARLRHSVDPIMVYSIKNARNDSNNERIIAIIIVAFVFSVRTISATFSMVGTPLLPL